MLFCTLIFGCKTDFENPNNPTETVVLETKDGLYSLAIGIREYFAVSSVMELIETPGFTTRELGVDQSYSSIVELAQGGSALPNDSDGITAPWESFLKVKGMAESLIDAAPLVDMDETTQAGLIAYGNFFKAMCLGYLIEMWEQVPIENGDDAEFSEKGDVYNEAIALLEEAKANVTAGVSSDFEENVLWESFDFLASINAMLARYYLATEQYGYAIEAANAGLEYSTTSAWTYDSNNQNPIWSRTNNSLNYYPQTNFGLLGDYIPEDGDGRIDFYLGEDAGTALSDCGGQAMSYAVGFFSESTTSIPVYLPGEMTLIKAEAYARQNDLSNAVTQLNIIREKTDDDFGINAGLEAWTGDTSDQDAILEEIYKNRCIELFMTGQRLADSKRFHPDFEVPTEVNTTNERNRNYYPYPYSERSSNSNTPDDPEI